MYKYNFVITSEKGDRLEYATVMWKSGGLSANDLGVCVINSENPIDTFFITNVGYNSIKKSAMELSFNNDTAYIKLSPTTSKLPEIFVISNGKTLEKGTIAESPNSFIINQTPAHVQGSVSIDIENDVAQILSVSFFVHKGSSTDLPLRVRIYKDNNGIPGEDILTSSVVAKKYNTNAWNEVLLDDNNLFVQKGKYYVAIEWLCTEQSKQNELKIGLSKNKNFGANTYWSFTNGWRQTKCLNDVCTNLMIKTKILQ